MLAQAQPAAQQPPQRQRELTSCLPSCTGAGGWSSMPSGCSQCDAHQHKLQEPLPSWAAAGRVLAAASWDLQPTWGYQHLHRTRWGSHHNVRPLSTLVYCF